MSNLSLSPCDPNPVYKPPLRERLRVKWQNWRVRRTGQALRTLKKAMRDDPDYADSWYASIAMAVYDESRLSCTCNFDKGHEADCAIVRAHDGHYQQVSWEQANNTAARIMQIAFDVKPRAWTRPSK